MKIALIITGFPRQYDKTYSSIVNSILSKYDTDVYICSWNKQEIDYDPHLDFNNIDKTRQIINTNIDDVCSLYQQYLKSYKFIDYDIYYNNRFSNISLLDRDNDIFKIDDHAKELGQFWIERIRDQWYVVQQGWNLIEDKTKYDIFIKTRFDVFLYNIYPQFDMNNLSISYAEFFNINGIKISDYIAHGNFNNMNVYCNMFDYIEKMYTDHNINIACSEKMIDFYLKEYSKIDYILNPFLFYKRIKRKTEGKTI